MTIQAVREAVLRLIDESELPEDMKARIPAFINMGQQEIAMVCPIDKSITIEQIDGLYLLPKDFYRAKRIVGGGRILGDYMILPDGTMSVNGYSSTITVYYSAFPKEITSETPDDTPLEIKPEAQTALTYYVAAQLNGMEYDGRPFSNFYAMYQGRMQNLLGENKGFAYVMGGNHV